MIAATEARRVATKIEPDCSTCFDSGIVVDDEAGQVKCRHCCCADCGDQVGPSALARHETRRVCPSCKPVVCEGCDAKTVLAALHEDDDLCEACHG